MDSNGLCHLFSSLGHEYLSLLLTLLLLKLYVPPSVLVYDSLLEDYKATSDFLFVRGRFLFGEGLWVATFLTFLLTPSLHFPF